MSSWARESAMCRQRGETEDEDPRGELPTASSPSPPLHICNGPLFSRFCCILQFARVYCIVSCSCCKSISECCDVAYVSRTYCKCFI